MTNLKTAAWYADRARRICYASDAVAEYWDTTEHLGPWQVKTLRGAVRRLDPEKADYLTQRPYGRTVSGILRRSIRFDVLNEFRAERATALADGTLKTCAVCGAIGYTTFFKPLRGSPVCAACRRGDS